MIRVVAAAAIAIFLTGCASNPDVPEGPVDCAKSLCGCYEDYSMPVTIKFTGSDGQPISGAVLICEDTSAALGTTNQNGLVRVLVKGKTSPGCGFIADCKIAYFRTTENPFGRPFWFGRAIRGSSNASDDGRIEIIKDDI